MGVEPDPILRFACALDGRLDPEFYASLGDRRQASRSTCRVQLLVPQWYHEGMPPTIRELMRELTTAGFENRGGKGSHRNFRHPKGVNITISGRAGSDAKRYQIRDVRRAIELTSDEQA